MSERAAAARVRIEPWSEEDLPLLRQTNSPEMMVHLGGPETEEQLAARHRLYLAINAEGLGRRFRIVSGPRAEAVGTIGYSERLWRDRTVYEIGWKVLPPFQSRGIATAAAVAAVADARAAGRHRYLHAFPSVDHHVSNAVCRRAGFSLLGECDVEYPRGSGTVKRSNDWRVDLFASR